MAGVNGLCFASSQIVLRWALSTVPASLPPAWVEMVAEIMWSRPGRVEAERVNLVTPWLRALGTHCQGQPLFGMLAPALTSSLSKPSGRRLKQ